MVYRDGQLVSIIHPQKQVPNPPSTVVTRNVLNPGKSHIATTSTHTDSNANIIRNDLFQRLQKQGTSNSNNQIIPRANDAVDLSGKSNMPAFEPPPKCIYKNLIIAGIDIDADIPHSFPSRNLILGIAANIDIKNFVIFCASLRQSSVKATTIIFMNDPIPAEHQKVAEQNDIILLVYDREKLEPAFIRSYHPSSLRWILFDWLFTIEGGKYGKMFDYVLTLDVRDSVFQSDPFELFEKEYAYDITNPHFQPSSTYSNIHFSDVKAVTGSGSNNDSRLFFFGENVMIPIDRCSWNSNWIRDSFGEEVLKYTKFFPISCSGISMGVTFRMVEYFNKMARVLLGEYACLPGKFPSCERNGVDQGIHNVLLHLNHLQPVSVKYPDTFPIVNLQSSPELMLHFINETVDSIKMLDHNVKYAVVHQYDRDPALQLELGKKYLPWIPWENPMADWAMNPTCKRHFGVVFGTDFLRGKCDLAMGRALTPASCCDVCMHQREGANATLQVDPKRESVRFCTGFAFSNGVCYMKYCPQREIQAMVGLMTDPNFIDLSTRDEKAVSGYLL